MGIIDNLVSRVVDRLVANISDEYAERSQDILKRRSYYYGQQPKMLRTKAGAPDYNLTINFTKKIVNTNVSLLFGKPVEFEYEEGSEAQSEYIEQMYEDNKGGIFFHNLARNGSDGGQVYCKIVPQAEGSPRLIPLDPSLMLVTTDPDDKDMVVMYTMQYKTRDYQNKEIARKEVIRMGYFEVQEQPDGTMIIIDSERDAPVQNWVIEEFVASSATGGKWVLTSSELWPYPDAPIVDWQNWPNPTDHYGLPDITDDEMGVQDAINFTVSNANKVIALYGHPQRYGKMLGTQSSVELGPDAMPSYSNPDSEIVQLPPLGDIPSISAVLDWLKKSLFDICQSVDIDSMADKLGQLTNFGLHVMYQDAMSKLNTKRELYGWGLREVNRRVLILANMEPAKCEIHWVDPLPVDQAGETTMYQADLAMGIVDKQTVAERRGYDWETVNERIKAEQKEMQQGQDDIGAFILKNFNQNKQPEMGANMRKFPPK
jgi:hypothetical protein